MFHFTNRWNSTLIVCLAFVISSNGTDSDCMSNTTIVAIQENEQVDGNVENRQIVRQIKRVIADQNEAWNRGDIEGFMKGYWKSEKLSFTSGDATIRGWQSTIDRYKSRYATREKMGVLKFDNLEITPLGAESAFVLGTWELTRKDDRPHGRFTLVFRRVGDEWRIVHDHTSAAEKVQADGGADIPEASDQDDAKSQSDGR